jgi:BarA-like signal transduction histidine kinase
MASGHVYCISTPTESKKTAQATRLSLLTAGFQVMYSGFCGATPNYSRDVDILAIAVLFNCCFGY